MSAPADTSGQTVRRTAMTVVHAAQLSMRRLLDVDPAVCAVLAIASLVAIAVYLLTPTDPSLLGRFLPEWAQGGRMVDSGPQRTAYRLFLAALLFGAIVTAMLPVPWGRTMQAGSVLVIAILGAMLVHGPAMGSRSLDAYLIGGVVIFVAAQLVVRPLLRRIVWAVIAAIVLLTAGPAVFGTLVPNPSDLPGIDQHYDFMFSQGRQLTAGHLLSGDNPAGYPPGYGLLPQMLVGTVAELGHPISYVGLIRIVQLGQAVFLAVLMSAVWIRTQSKAVDGRVLALLVAVMLAAPWLYTLGLGVMRPNLSGFRCLLMVVASLIAGLACRARPLPAGAMIGATAAIAPLYNLETGVGVIAGLGVAWLLRVRSLSLATQAASAAAGFAAFAAVLVAFGTLYWAIVGAIPSAVGVLSLFDNIRLFASGFLGLAPELRPIVLVILLHASYVLVAAIRSILNRGYPAPAPMDAAVATMILGWLPYYVNRPFDWNLWVVVSLYPILLAPAIAGHGRRFAALLVAVLIVLPTPMRVAKANLFVPARAGWAPGWVLGWKSGCADGLILPDEVCAHLRQRADTLRQFAGEGPIYWSSSLPLLTLHMSGVRGLLWTAVLWPQLFTPEDVERVAASVAMSNPRNILMDNPDDPFLNFKRSTLQTRLLHRLPANYCPVGLVGGWQVFKLANSC
jgi:hypothetical protein